VAYGLVAYSRCRESCWRVSPFRVFILCDVRTVLYAGSRVGWIPYTAKQYGPKTFPILGPARVCLSNKR
jgi:hypothetical protein